MIVKPVNSILLDLDGTLTDPFPGISRCIEYALESLDVPAPGSEQLRGWIGPPLLDSFKAYFKALNLACSEHHALELYRERFASKGLFENSVYPDIPRILEGLKFDGKKLYLATAKPITFARRILQYFDLDAYFAACHGSELDGSRTDKVELLQYIIEQEGIDPHQSAMVGDRHHDMVAGRYHGMRSIGVTWGYGSRRELLDSGAGILVASPTELFQQLCTEMNS